MILSLDRHASPSLRRLAPGALVGLLLGLAAADGAQAATTSQENGGGRIDVSVERGRLTVEAKDAPLAKLLTAIAEQGDFPVRIKGELDSRVTVKLTDVPLAAGIRRVVGRNSLIMTHRTVRGGQPEQLASVLVSRGQRPAALRPVAAETTFRLDGVYGPAAPSDRVARLRAIRGLADRGGAQSVERLTQVLLLERDPVLRRMAILSLGRIGGDGVVPPLGAMLEDPDIGVRMQAVRALGRVGTPAALTALEPALSDAEPNVRLQVIKMLGRWQAAPAVEALRDVLLDEPDPLVRREAVAALTGHRGEEADFALEIAAADSDERVRDAALAAIDRAGANLSSRF